MQNFLKSMNRLVLLALLTGIYAEAAAENRWIVDTESMRLSPVIRDEIRNRIYLADSGRAELVVIDSNTEQVVARLPVRGTIADMAISKNNTFLDVAAGGVVSRFNLNTLKKLKEYSIAEVSITSVAFDSYERVVVFASSSSWGWIYYLNSAANRVIHQFGVGPNLNRQVYRGLLKADPSGTVLFVGETGLSPLSIYKLDITKPKAPLFLAEDAHGSLGSNLRDFAISPRYNEIYVASGSPYGIQVVDSNTLQPLALLSTGPYPVGVDVARSGERIFGLPQDPYDGFLYKFEAENRSLVEAYPLLADVLNGAGQVRGLAVDRFGEKAFVIHGNTHPSIASMKVQIVDTAESCAPASGGN